jgi:radical SAM protein with 4Fe4S-binding SPASM domain
MFIAGNHLKRRWMPPESTQSEVNRIFRTLSTLGKRAQVGYTIFQHGLLDLSWVIDIIDQTGCSRSVRLGIAQPAKGENTYVHPKNYRQVGRQVATFIEKAARNEVRVELDCGFVRCMFSEEEMRVLTQCQAHIAWRCSPVIDIDLDGSAFACFPLEEITRIEDALSQTATALRSQFEKKLSYFRICGIFPECSSCNLRISEKCSGGCLASTLKRMKNQPFRYPIPDDYAAKFQQNQRGTQPQLRHFEKSP